MLNRRRLLHLWSRPVLLAAVMPLLEACGTAGTPIQPAPTGEPRAAPAQATRAAEPAQAVTPPAANAGATATSATARKAPQRQQEPGPPVRGGILPSALAKDPENLLIMPSTIHNGAVRDEAKFERVIPFGESLPTIRERTGRDLARHGLPEEKMLAVVVRLLESTLIRVCDDEYARQNHSFGLTTMLRQHVEFAGARIRFHFRGKSGKHHDIELVDKRLAAVIKRSQHLPGERLFEYADTHGHFRPVESADVNRYLHQLTGQDLTAKDFRTWAGS